MIRGNVLQYAAQSKNDKVLRLLLETNEAEVNVNSRDRDGRAPLHYLALNPSCPVTHLIDMSSMLMDRGADVNLKDNNGDTALHLLVREQNDEAETVREDGVDLKITTDSCSWHGKTSWGLERFISDLVARGADVNCKNGYGNSPLHLAARAGSKRNLKILLKKGADVNSRNNNGWTPLHFLAKSTEAVDQVEYLVVQGADVNAKDNMLVTPLGFAVSSKNYKVSQLLLDSGADVDAKDHKGQTYLHILAVEKTNPSKLIVELVDRGADVNARDALGNTPLHLAIMAYNRETFELFLNLGADVNAKNDDDRTPLHCLFSYLEFLVPMDETQETEDKNDRQHVFVDYLKQLLDAGADINSRDHFDRTPLHGLADNIKRNSRVALLEMVSHGADLNCKDKEGNTPFHVATLRGVNTELVDFFLNLGADVHEKNNQDQTVLFFAVKSKNVETIKTLIDREADVNNIDKSSTRTLLNLACSISTLPPKRNEVIKLLLKSGANVNELDANGRTPLINLLDSTRDPWSIETLLRHGADVNTVTPLGRHVLFFELKNDLWKTFLQYVAKFQADDKAVNSIITDAISRRNDYNDYFTECKEELLELRRAKIGDFWITFYNLLVDDKVELVKYAHESLIKIFQSTDLIGKFPIYGEMIENRFLEGIQQRKLRDGAANSFSHCLRIHDPRHLIIDNILKHLSSEDWSNLREL